MWVFNLRCNRNSRILYRYSWLKIAFALAFKEGFPCGSAGKESACNVGNLGLIPGLGRSPGKGKGYPLQYSGLEYCKESDLTEQLSLSLLRASLVAQMVEHLSAMLETRVQSLGWEDPLEKATAPHFSTLAWKIPWTEEPDRLQSLGSQRVGHDWATLFTYCFKERENGSIYFLY